MEVGERRGMLISLPAASLATAGDVGKGMGLTAAGWNSPEWGVGGMDGSGR